MTARTVAEQLQLTQQALAATDNARLEASILLCHILQWQPAKLISHSDAAFSSEQQAALDALCSRRIAGEPSAYLVGERAFWTLDLKVTADTLIPRPDTETLVEFALEAIADTTAPRVLDLGTGSGAIALSIASERPDALVEATDFSLAALDVARENARQLDIIINAWHGGSWFEALPCQSPAFDLIVSNPPYIANSDPHLETLKYEPLAALTAGDDGLDDIRNLIANSREHLCSQGLLALEHGHDQARAVAQLFADHDYTDMQQRHDLAGIVRVSAARKR